MKQYQDQSDTISKNIQALQDQYNTEKDQLDQYWSYRLSQDQLQQQAERMIQQEGYQNAITDATAFASQMNQVLASIQMPNITAGGGIASGLGLYDAGLSSSGSIGSSMTYDQIRQIIQNYGSAWNAATSQSEKDLIHEKLSEQLQGSSAQYNSKTGEWSYGGYILNGNHAGQIAQFAKGGETGNQEGLAYLHPNEVIFNSTLTDQLRTFLENNAFRQTHLHFRLQHIRLQQIIHL